MTAKVIALVLLALLVAAPAMGQMTVQKQIYFGIKGGVNLAKLAIDSDSGRSADEILMGLGGGATLAFVISPGMTLDIDFLYLQKGAKDTFELMPEEGGSSPGTGEMKYKYTDLVINPMLRFTVQNEGMRPFFMAGPEIGFLLDAEWEVEGGDVAYTQDMKDYTKGTAFGVNLGAGLEFPSGNRTFFLEARYALGLTNIEDYPDDEGTKDEVEYSSSTKHRGIYLMAGIRF
jgi:hypothetical protein